MTWFQPRTALAATAPVQHPEFPGARMIGRDAKPALNIAQLEETAYQRGWADQKIASTEALAALAETHRAELAATEDRVRKRMLEAEGAKVATLVGGIPDRVVAGVLEAVAPVLRKLFMAAVHDRAISELGQLVRDVVTGGSEIAVTVTAPAELIEAVKSKLPHDVRLVTCVVGAIGDVEIKIGDLELSAGLEGWRQSVSRGEL